LAINMITSARPAQGQRDDPGAGSASASSTCPITGPALALPNAVASNGAGGDEGMHRERDD